MILFLQYSLIVREYVKWIDPRLKYSDFQDKAKSISDYHKTHWIDVTSEKDEFWLPSIVYQDLVDKTLQEEQYYMTPAGRILIMRKFRMTFKCTFDFSLYPNDYQECFIRPYVNGYSNKEVMLD